MTTTAHEDQFTPATQTIESVRQPYDTVAILRRNIAALEVALKQQTELKERAEVELAKLAQQEPIKYLYRVTDCFGHDVLRDDPRDATIIETIPLYAAPVPAPAVPTGCAIISRTLTPEAWKRLCNADIWPVTPKSFQRMLDVLMEVALLQSAEVRHD